MRWQKVDTLPTDLVDCAVLTTEGSEHCPAYYDQALNMWFLDKIPPRRIKNVAKWRYVCPECGQPVSALDAANGLCPQCRLAKEDT